MAEAVVALVDVQSMRRKMKRVPLKRTAKMIEAVMDDELNRLVGEDGLLDRKNKTRRRIAKKMRMTRMMTVTTDAVGVDWEGFTILSQGEMLVEPATCPWLMAGSQVVEAQTGQDQRNETDPSIELERGPCQKNDVGGATGPGRYQRTAKAKKQMNEQQKGDVSDEPLLSNPWAWAMMTVPLRLVYIQSTRMQAMFLTGRCR